MDVLPAVKTASIHIMNLGSSSLCKINSEELFLKRIFESLTLRNTLLPLTRAEKGLVGPHISTQTRILTISSNTVELEPATCFIYHPHSQSPNHCLWRVTGKSEDWVLCSTHSQHSFIVQHTQTVHDIKKHSVCISIDITVLRALLACVSVNATCEYGECRGENVSAELCELH